jgi:hypothetical protein
MGVDWVWALGGAEAHPQKRRHQEANEKQAEARDIENLSTNELKSNPHGIELYH